MNIRIKYLTLPNLHKLSRPPPSLSQPENRTNPPPKIQLFRPGRRLRLPPLRRPKLSPQHDLLQKLRRARPHTTCPPKSSDDSHSTAYRPKIQKLRPSTTYPPRLRQLRPSTTPPAQDSEASAAHQAPPQSSATSSSCQVPPQAGPNPTMAHQSPYSGTIS